jgi:uncharacterized protein DUF6338
MDIPASWSELLDSQALSTLLALLPGLLAASIVDSLTVKQERGIVERIVQALLLTFISYVVWSIVLVSVAKVQEQLGLTTWAPTQTRDLMGLAASAVFVGIAITYLVNSGRLHSILSHRWIRLTKRSSRPSEWYEAFWLYEMYTVIHLKDGRRLYGFPRLYPEQSARGHLLLEDAIWLDGTDETTPPTKVLLSTDEVRFVEFVPYKKEENTDVKTK